MIWRKAQNYFLFLLKTPFKHLYLSCTSDAEVFSTVQTSLHADWRKDSYLKWLMGIENKQQTPAVRLIFQQRLKAFICRSRFCRPGWNRLIRRTRERRFHAREDDECSGDKCFSLPWSEVKPASSLCRWQLLS